MGIIEKLDKNKVKKHEHSKEGKYIKSVVYGGLDGIITTFAIVAGVAGASLQSAVVLILGFANLIADGLSMAIGDYLSTKAEREYQQDERKTEQWQVEHELEKEKKQLLSFYRKKGFSQKDAKSLVDTISKNKKAMVDMMMAEELGIVQSDESPIKNGVVTFISFVCFGFIPLLSYLIAIPFPSLSDMSFRLAIILTAATLFSLGAVKVKVTKQNLVRSGIEMLVIGGIAAFAAYGIGYVVSTLV